MSRVCRERVLPSLIQIQEYTTILRAADLPLGSDEVVDLVEEARSSLDISFEEIAGLLSSLHG